MRSTTLLAALLATLAVLDAQAPEIGNPLPAFTVQAEGKRIAFDRFAADAPVALFAPSAPLDTAACAELDRAMAALAGDRIRTLIASGTCPDLKSAARPATSPSTDPFRAASARLIVVDTFGVVRLIRPLEATAIGVRKAAAVATEWEAGRQSFLTNCAHCHGTDGADTSYAGIKTLAGISRRMSDNRILEGGRMFGAVDMSNWSQANRDALLAYIRGL